VIVLAKPIVLLTVISLSLYLIFRDSFSKWNISVGFLPYFLFTAASAALIRKFVFDARVPKSDGMKIVLHSPQEKGGLRSFFDSLSLTRKERSIAYLILKGMTNEEIANEEMMSVLTVKKHVSSIYRKSSVRSRVELMQAIRSMLS
jgi:DNA-binding NarL/FixJ family response regulator